MLKNLHGNYRPQYLFLILIMFIFGACSQVESPFYSDEIVVGECINYGEYAHLLDTSINLPFCNKPLVVGEYLYTSGAVYRVFPDGSYEFVMSLPINDCSDLSLQGSLLFSYFSSGFHNISQMKIFDVSESGSPVLMAELVIDVSCLTVASDFAYIATPDQSLLVYDISNLEFPTQIAQLDLTLSATTMIIQEDQLFIGTENAGILVFDISMPEQPSFSGSSPFEGIVHKLYAREDHLFVTHGNLFSSADISTQGEVDILASVEDDESFASCMEISNDLAYLGGGSGFRIVDISDLETPVITGSLAGDLRFFTHIHDQFLLTFQSCMGCYSTVEVDLASPETRPATLYEIDINEPASIAMVRDLCYAADEESMLHVIDLSSIDDPQLVNCVSIPSGATKIQIQGDRGYISHERVGLSILNLSEPLDPRLTYEVPVPGRSVDLCVIDNTIAIADDSLGVHLLKINTPLKPDLQGYIDVQSRVSVLASDGRFLYFTDETMLWIADVSDPMHPLILGEYALSTRSRLDSYSLVAWDGAVFIGTSVSCPGIGCPLGELEVIDVSNPASPSLKEIVPCVIIHARIAIVGNHMYRAGRSSGASGRVCVFDVSNHDIMDQIGGTGTQGNPRHILASSAGICIVNSDNLEFIPHQCIEDF